MTNGKTIQVANIEAGKIYIKSYSTEDGVYIVAYRAGDENPVVTLSGEDAIELSKALKRAVKDMLRDFM